MHEEFIPSTVIARIRSRLNYDGPIPPHCPELGPCHLWTRGVDKDGYGQVGFRHDGKSYGGRIHRALWVAEHGPIPDGLNVCHRCDTPGCGNVAHMFLGTTLENNQDRNAKGRQASGERSAPKNPAFGERNGASTHPEGVRRGAENGMARLTESDIITIRALARTSRCGEGMSFPSLATLYHVNKATIRRVVRGYSWQHVL